MALIKGGGGGEEEGGKKTEPNVAAEGAKNSKRSNNCTIAQHTYIHTPTRTHTHTRRTNTSAYTDALTLTLIDLQLSSCQQVVQLTSFSKELFFASPACTHVHTHALGQVVFCGLNCTICAHPTLKIPSPPLHRSRAESVDTSRAHAH